MIFCFSRRYDTISRFSHWSEDVSPLPRYEWFHFRPGKHRMHFQIHHLYPTCWRIIANHDQWEPPDPSDLTVVFQSFPNQSDAYLGGCYGEFPASKNESRAIIEHDTDLFAIDFAGTPVQVYKAQAVFSFIPDIGFPAFFLLGVFFSQTILEKNLMDGVMRYMLAVFVLDYYFEASCAGILLSVDASTVSKLSLMLISDISRIRRLSDSLMLIVGRPNFLGANGSLVFIQCPQTLLTVRMLTLIFISLWFGSWCYWF